MASETHQENGVLNDEPASRTPSAAIFPEPHSTALDTAEHTDKDSQGPVSGSNTDDVGAAPGARPTPQQGSTHLKQENHEPTPENDVAELSEDGAGERPVRQKLKETSIAGVPRPNSPEDHAMASQVASVAGADSVNETSSVEARGRLWRKRSRGDMNEDENQDDISGVTNTDETGHRRKRSRDSKTDDQSSDNQGQPKSKLTAGDKQDITDSMDTKPLADEGGIRTPTEELKSTERDAANRILSPKKKRSRDQFDKDHLKSDALDEKCQEGAASAKTGESFDRPKAVSANRTVEGEPEKKRHRDDSQDRSSQGDSDLVSKKASAPNPFSNTLGVSPFASMSSKPTQLTSKGTTEKKEQPMTSASAFASSKLASFASSEKSPFSSLGGGSTIGLKSASPTKNTTVNKPPQTSSSAFTASPFAAAAASSPFGAFGGGKSAFSRSGFGTGFSAATPKLGGGLAGFAASTTGGSAILGAAGSKHGDEKNVEKGRKGGDDGKSTFEGLEEEKGDERFHEQQTETGEEGEDTIFSCRGKLYHFDGKEWKERGVGVFKVNIREPANGDDDTDESSEEQQPLEDKVEEKEEKEEVKAKTDEDDNNEPKKKTARVIMRADGVWRVILNIPIFKGMKAGDPSGAAPKGKQVHFAGFEEGKSVPFLFRTGNEDVAKELCVTIQKLQESL
ncbi:hypothetical protein BDBG_07134 [Blastomyces gilchristii SLH14081]|uniref:RanBD1 domain-containing protein n=1 Tax=Blastomyces gilchristii (strain SLH14081) TaxID=559298 RepID=A0A179UU98_BLAGS|nr:uncharacterized protein BDBG_07134 [Blastomyces gilchristii SLH14081]OAT11696.1 hypothetical protein BDBG_07134 [Blastomyces gilchristii SLH14081]